MRRPYRNRASASGQGGFALIAVVALIVLISAYLLVQQLNASTVGDKRNQNAKVLNQAKQALIGYVAQQASQSGEDNPGRLPCPEAFGYIGTSSEGISGPQIAPSVPCATVATVARVGRLPWRTLGLDKLLDAASEPLWYVVSPGWTLQTSSTLLTINSNTRGQLVVDGLPAPNEVIALIIAPGPAMNVQAAPGCTARVQSRTAPSPGIDPLDYIECFNSAALTFSTTGPSTSFNDQVLRVTTADLLPEIEAAIAVRIQREIVPLLKSVYASAQWGLTATNPLFPYAAPWANPGTSDFRGVAGTFQGLLPFNQTQLCTVLGNPRCLPAPLLVDWSSGTPPVAYKAGGYGTIESQSCSWQPSSAVKDIAECDGTYKEDDTSSFTLSQQMRVEMSATFSNVAMGLRMLDNTVPRMHVEARDDDCAPTCPWQPQAVTQTVTMNPNGSATITFGAWLPNIDSMGWMTIATYRIRLERAVIVDHPLLDASVSSPTGWFARNEWYRLVYYALAPNHAATGTAPRSCESTTPTCLSVTNVSPTNKQRAILILAGRSLTNPAGRPNGTLADFVEFGNADGNLVFEQRRVSRATNAPFNDRIVVLDANP